MTTPTDRLNEVDVDQPGKRVTLGKVAVAFIILSVIVFWAWALGPFGPRGNPDNLDDQTYSPAAVAVCSAALAEIDQLEPAFEAESPDDRADTLVEANAILTTMVADLNTLVDPTGTEHDALILATWLSDWEIYLGDRADHVSRLRSEGDVAFQVSRVESSSVSGRIEWFAKVNQMIECGPPLDL